LRCVHRVGLSGRFLELLPREVEHPKLAVTSPEQIHRLQTRVWVLARLLQFRQGLSKLARVKKMLAQFQTKLEISRIQIATLTRIIEDKLAPIPFRQKKPF